VSETRKLAAILVADIVGYSRLAGADEDRILARLRTLRSDLIDPTIAVHHGRIIKRTGDGSVIEFRSVVDAVNCAIEVQRAMVERNAEVASDKRIQFRIGIHLGDVVEESDGDLMGDGVNIAARLQGVAKPGAICLSEQAYWQVKGRLDLKVDDLGPTQLKNIGEPIHVYSLEVGQPLQAKPAPSATQADQAKAAYKRRMGSTSLAAALVALLLLVAAGGWYILNGRAPKQAEAGHLSIVVLPFTNLSGDPSQDYFADGITENLTTDLSRIRNSFVVARNTAFTFKGKTIDAKEIGKELGVRYILEGSAQRDQNRVRVNAQLIDAETGAHLWADRFEEDVADLFKLQDQVVARLANTLGFELVKAEAQKGARANNPDAGDLVMRGLALLQLQRTKDRVDAARALFDRALAIDPNDADALAGSAYAYMNHWAGAFGGPEIDYDAKILGQADRAIALAPDSLWAYFAKSVYLYLTHRASEAVATADAGLVINPNFAPLWVARGRAEAFLGDFEQSKSDIRQGMKLSPRDPLIGVFHWYLADAELGLGHFDAAVEDDRKSIDSGYHNYTVYESLAAAYALEGNMDQAKPALVEAQRLQTPLTVKWQIVNMPNIPPLIEGLRKLGLPEECDPRSHTGWDGRPCEPVTSNASAPDEAKHLSIVVLPFTNLSNDPSQDYYADGITENLTTELSRVRSSFVIARNTAFTYKGKSVDAKEIGKELGVRYVLEGSVQRDQNRVRVNVQLVDAESGAHLWADRFDEDVADLFKLQDQVVSRMGNTLGFELVKAEAEKSTRSNNPDAVDLAMRGWATMWRSYPQPPKEKREFHYASLALFDRALKADPNDADALAGEAFTYMALFAFGEAAEANLDAKIIDPADRAIALAPDDMRAYVAKSFYLALTGRAAEALRAADSGLAINPNSAPLLDARTLAEIVLGRFEQAKSDAQQAMRLSPRDPEIPNRLINLGMAELGLGHFDAAVVEFQKAIDAGAHYFIPYANLAAAYALDGKTEDAKTALAEARRLNPQLTVKWLTDHAPNLPPLFDGLRKVGLAEE
jgi:TolB-like protein/class 3 adenylate cyclase/Flp pilus assembly protein TadD